MKWEIRQRAPRAVPIDRINYKSGVLKNSSYATICTPPIEKWGVFEEETEGTFRPLLETAPYPYWRVVVDESRTLQPLEIPLLIKIHRKRGMGWLIALDEPIFNKPAKPKEPINLEPYYDYVI